MNTMKKIAIADDHDIIRYAIKLLLEKNPVLSVVADTNELAKIVEMCRANKPDLLLLDINFENGDSLNILKQLKKEDRHLKVLVYSTYSIYLQALTINPIIF